MAKKAYQLSGKVNYTLIISTKLRNQGIFTYLKF